MVKLVELRHSNLHAATDGKAQSPGDWKWTYNDSGGQKDLLPSIQHTARPKRRILLKHGPDSSFDTIIDCGVEYDRSAEETGAADGKIRTNCVLNVPRTEALPHADGGRQNGMIEPIRGLASRE